MSITAKTDERGIYYVVRVQVGGRRIAKNVRGSKKKAVEVETKLKRDLIESDHNKFMNRPQKCTYGEAALKWGRSGAPKSMSSHIRITLEYLKDYQLSEVPEHAQRMKEVMIAQGLSNQTINRRLAVVRRILNLCYREWGLLDFPLAEKISLLSEKNTSREHHLSSSEVDALLLACDHPQAANFIRLAAYTGARKSELFRATNKDFKDGHLRIKVAKSGKGRTIPVPKELWSVCHALPFTLTKWALRQNFEKAREAINRPEIRFHDLRHSYATWLISKGVDPAVVRDILGHSSLAVTSKYTHSLGIDIDEVLGSQ